MKKTAIVFLILVALAFLGWPLFVFAQPKTIFVKDIHWNADNSGADTVTAEADAVNINGISDYFWTLTDNATSVTLRSELGLGTMALETAANYLPLSAGSGKALTGALYATKDANIMGDPVSRGQNVDPVTVLSIQSDNTPRLRLTDSGTNGFTDLWWSNNTHEFYILASAGVNTHIFTFDEHGAFFGATGIICGDLQSIGSSYNGGTGTGAVTSSYGSTKDGIGLQGRNGGTGSFTAWLVPGVLSASRTYTGPDADITIAGINLAQTWTAAQDFSSGVTGTTAAMTGEVTGKRAIATVAGTTHTVTGPQALGYTVYFSSASGCAVTLPTAAAGLNVNLFWVDNDGTKSITAGAGDTVCYGAVSTAGSESCLTTINDTSGFGNVSASLVALDGTSWLLVSGANGVWGE